MMELWGKDLKGKRWAGGVQARRNERVLAIGD